MLKKAAFLFSMILLVSSVAYAGDLRPYIGLRGGVSNLNSDLTNFPIASRVQLVSATNVFFGAAAAGMQYKFLRAELEYGYRDIASGGLFDYKLKMQSYMLNFYFDFPTKFFLQPYLSAGAGFSNMKMDVGIANASNDIFSYGLGAGVSYPVTGNINIDLGYRFLKAGGMDVGVNLQNYSHDMYLGLRYTFGKCSCGTCGKSSCCTCECGKAKEDTAAQEKAAQDTTAKKAADEQAAAQKATDEQAAQVKAAQDEAVQKAAEEQAQKDAAAKAAQDEAAKKTDDEQAAAQKKSDEDAAMAAQIAEAKARRAKPVLESFSLNMANFAAGKAELTEASKADIKAKAEEIKKLDYKKVTIEGHTDSTGSAAANKELSVKRAKAVYDEFAANGIPEDKMAYEGFGSSMPAAGNDTEAGRAKNRRVEIFVE